MWSWRNAPPSHVISRKWTGTGCVTHCVHLEVAVCREARLRSSSWCKKRPVWYFPKDKLQFSLWHNSHACSLWHTGSFFSGVICRVSIFKISRLTLFLQFNSGLLLLYIPYIAHQFLNFLPLEKRWGKWYKLCCPLQTKLEKARETQSNLPTLRYNVLFLCTVKVSFIREKQVTLHQAALVYKD